MIIQYNQEAFNSNRMLGLTSCFQTKTTERLSSGYKINRAADDAAGLAISEKMRRQIRGLNQGAENIQDGISVCQVADGALEQVDEILHRMNELAVKSGNGTLSDEDRSYIQSEVDELRNEIIRIGKETSFNGLKIFNREVIEERIGSITKLVTSPSASTGRMTEAYLAADGKYYPSASLDFTNVDDTNISKLDDTYFSFTCPLGCREKFKIVFDADMDYNESTVTGLTGKSLHTYTIGIKDATGGSDIVDFVYSFVKDNLPDSAKNSTDALELSTATGGNGVGVSHASALVKDGNKLIVLSNRPQSTETAAQNYGKNLTGENGQVDSSRLTNLTNEEFAFIIPIQCSANAEDVEYVKTKVVDAEALSINTVDMSTQSGALNSIDKIKDGMEYIAQLRSEIGAQQNRLEHAYNSNRNTSENTSAAESRIRDTDMDKTMIAYSNNNVLLQVGTAMLTQANQNGQAVLSLLK